MFSSYAVIIKRTAAVNTLATLEFISRMHSGLVRTDRSLVQGYLVPLAGLINLHRACQQRHLSQSSKNIDHI